MTGAGFALRPCRCIACGKQTEPRPLGQTPAGWARGVVVPGDAIHGYYWCPECAR